MYWGGIKYFFLAGEKNNLVQNIHPCLIRGEADVPIFETQSKTYMISANKIVITLKFGTAVTFVENNMELWRNGGEKKTVYLRWLKIVYYGEKRQIKFGGKWRFSAGAAVLPPFLHSSILFTPKATAVQNFRAVTLLWAEILHVLLLVSKRGTSASPQ